MTSQVHSESETPVKPPRPDDRSDPAAGGRANAEPTVPRASGPPARSTARQLAQRSRAHQPALLLVGLLSVAPNLLVLALPV